MKLGTLGFVGARLSQARDALGLSKLALADLMSVSRQTVSDWERDESSPVPDTFQRLADRLSFPPQYFLKHVPSPVASATFFRTAASTTKMARTRARQLVLWLHELTEYVGESVVLPAVDLPELSVPADPRALGLDEIEGLADAVRASWGLGDGPISNIVWLMENHGVVVARTSLESPKLDGLSCWLDGRPYVMLNADVSAARSRFDAAHELGHLLLHRKVEQKQLNDASVFGLIEEQAHRFAAAFCFPASAFAREAMPVSIERFLSLKDRWRLSVKMMIHRAHDLQLIEDDRHGNMHRIYGARKWRSRGEPMDDVQMPERPRMVSKTIEALLDNEIHTGDEIAHAAPFNEKNLARLSGLPSARLAGRVATVHEFQPQMRLLDGGSSSGQPGVLVPFRRRGNPND